MVFNIQKFLVENKLTNRARLEEDAMTKTDAEQIAMSDEEGDEDIFDPASADPYGGEYNVSKYGTKMEPLSTSPTKSDDREPGETSVKMDRPTKNLHTKELKLKDLEDKKDALLMQLKSGQLSLDQYKAAIGNIPAQIKKLRADIEQMIGPDLGDGEELA